MLNEHVQSSKPSYVHAHAINCKDGWRQSIFHGYSGEFRTFLWCEFVHFSSWFDAHVGNYPSIDQICA